MSQVERTANDLIIQALRQTGEFRTNDPIDGYHIPQALDLLNQILDSLSASNITIPWVNTIEFPMEIGKDTYSVSTLPGADISGNRITDLIYANFRLIPLDNSIIQPISVLQDVSYYINPRFSDLKALPSLVFLENRDLESLIKFYPKPDQEYPITLKVKQMLDSVSLNTVLTAIPQFWHRFLRYLLTKELIPFYPTQNWKPEAEQELQSIFQTIMGNTADLACQPTTLLMSRYNLNWPTILAPPQ
jgi:hypothetical protein